MKYLFWILPLSLIACAPTKPPSKIELCEQTVRAYGPLRDSLNQGDAYADLFTENGEFHLGGDVTKGRAALKGRYRTANKTTQWQHFMQDVNISQNGGKLTGTTRFVIYLGPRDSKPVQFTRQIIGTYTDAFVMREGRCKIKTRKVSITFDTASD